MQLFILKTDLKTADAVDRIRPVLNLHPEIRNWNVDTEDIDNVMRIESTPTISETDILTLLRQYGVYGEQLTD